jgi:phosphate transport system substrate-binding protein
MRNLNNQIVPLPTGIIFRIFLKTVQMKKIFILISSCLYIFFYAGCHRAVDDGDGKTSGRITISGAFALYPLAVKWGEEYKKIHPKIRFDISAGGAGKGMTDALSEVVDIGLVSRSIYPEEVSKGAAAYAVAKDAVVPTFSTLHPQLKQILSRGMTKESLENIFITGKCRLWSQANIESTLPIHVYTRSDAAGAAESWAKYFGKKQEDLLGVGVFGDPGVAQAVIKDVSAVGFNNLIYIYDSETKKQVNGIRIIPIDFNGNGQIDADENFYDSLDSLIAAITAGKFPSPPARELFFVTHGKPKKKIVTEFIQWVLSEGQQYVQESGYIELPQENTKASLEKLNE